MPHFRPTQCPARRSGDGTQLLAEVRAKRWHVYAKAPLAGPKQVLDYLARYTHRIAISNERLVTVEHDTVRLRYKDYAAGAARKEMTLDAGEFRRRWLLHVVPRGFMRVATTGCSPTARARPR